MNTHYHVHTEGIAAVATLVFRSKRAAERYVEGELAEDIRDGLVRAHIEPCRKACLREGEE
jgi:hypothetical protein